MRLFYTKDEIKNILKELNENENEFDAIIKNNYKEISWNDHVRFINKEDLKPFVNRITKKTSDEELRFALALEINNIDYSYQPPKLELLGPHTTHYASYKGITYTPDFLIEYNNRKILVEVKGFIPLQASFKYKIYDYLISTKYKEYEYYICRWYGNKKQKNMQLYFYNSNVSKKITKTKKTAKSFWDETKIILDYYNGK